MDDMLGDWAIRDVLMAAGTFGALFKMISVFRFSCRCVHFLAGMTAGTGHLMLAIMDVAFTPFADEVGTGRGGVTGEALINKVRLFTEDMSFSQTTT